MAPNNFPNLAAIIIMETPEIAACLRRFIRERYKVPENDPDFTDDVDLFNYGYIDSFGAVDLTSFVEKEFGIQFKDSDWVNTPLSTIQQFAKFITRRKKGEI
jgi:methoxymalonate biosynthesis acyl carrier protein